MSYIIKRCRNQWWVYFSVRSGLLTPEGRALPGECQRAWQSRKNKTSDFSFLFQDQEGRSCRAGTWDIWPLCLFLQSRGRVSRGNQWVYWKVEKTSVSETKSDWRVWMVIQGTDHWRHKVPKVYTRSIKMQAYKYAGWTRGSGTSPRAEKQNFRSKTGKIHQTLALRSRQCKA